jgi:hypothetical protein
MSPGNPFDADLVVALHMVRDDHAALARIAEGGGGRAHSQAQRAQAWLALGDHAAALREYEAATLDRASELIDLVTDDWIWRLPHVINRAHLRLRAGDPRGREELLQLREELVQVTAQGVVNPQLEYWAASASAVLGEQEAVRRHLGQAERAGWRHDWWAQRDWNLQAGEGR